MTFARAVVTGASGFLGSALVSALRARGVAVTALALEAPADASVPFHRVEIERPASLAAVPASLWGGDDTVLFHLAGIAHQRTCHEQPARAFAVNVQGTAEVLAEAQRRQVRRVVFPSTAVVYGSLPRPAREDDPVAPAGVYAATKLAAEQVLAGFAAAYGMAADVARLGNIYGAGAPRDTVTSILLAQAVAGEPLRVKTLRPVRDFVYVRDAASGLIAMAETQQRGCRVFNLGTGVASSVGDFGRALCRALGRPASQVEASGELSDDSTLVLDVQKLKTAGWSPQWTLDAGVADSLAELRKSS